MNRVRALVVVDEPLARRTLCELIAEVDWLAVAGEAADGRAAVESIERLRPDLVFLDVQLPELTGLEVLERIDHRPAVVFTTAYDRYAVAAFEVEAVDYLVKPFGRRRFQATLERVRRRLEASTEADGGAATLARARAALAAVPARRLFARRGDRILPLPVEAVVRAEAAGDYAAVHAGGEVYHLALTLGELERRLDPERFLRVHRAHLINLDRVVQLRPFDDRRLTVTLSDGAEVVASRAGSQRLRELIG